MSLNMKRYRYLIPISILFLWVLIYYWNHRIISVNIWNWWEITTNFYDIDNTINLFDTTQIHEIKILITEEKYKDMIDTYVNTLEKEWYKADIIIDGVSIYNVWIRLKWEYSLTQLWFINWLKEKDQWTINYDLKLPLLVKFDKNINQTYQWHEMISLRVGLAWPNETLLSEPYAFELYQLLWQPSPDTSYGSVQINWKDTKLFLISELPEDKYFLEKWFWNDNWILYKAWNFVNFVYLGDDPTLYSNYFTQKTRVNDYDFSPLIRMLKFITESNNENFEQEIDNYIDVKSVITLLAIDDFLWNNDSFGGMWSNYYLYYHLWNQKFYILTWDQNLALWIVLWGPLWFPAHKASEIKAPISPNFTWWNMATRWWMWSNSYNALKLRLLNNETFKAMYDDIYSEIEKIALESNFSENFFEKRSSTLLNYSQKDQLISENNYLRWLTILKSYLNTYSNRKRRY